MLVVLLISQKDYEPCHVNHTRCRSERFSFSKVGLWTAVDNAIVLKA